MAYLSICLSVYLSEFQSQTYVMCTSQQLANGTAFMCTPQFICMRQNDTTHVGDNQGN